MNGGDMATPWHDSTYVRRSNAAQRPVRVLHGQGVRRGGRPLRSLRAGHLRGVRGDQAGRSLFPRQMGGGACLIDGLYQY